MFGQMLLAAKANPSEFSKLAGNLFAAMKDGGLIGCVIHGILSAGSRRS